MVLGCTTGSNYKENNEFITNAAEKCVLPDEKPDNSKYHTTRDTVDIITIPEDTLQFSKEEFNRIVDNHPEFFDEYPLYPDEAYARYAENDSEFGGEAGQDVYYILYAYFLQRREGQNEYAVQRKTLIEIYTTLNTIYEILAEGGTYWGHQYARLLAYAEYDLMFLSEMNGGSEQNVSYRRSKKNSIS
ncbi:MAG: hypothetical protein LRY55_06775 [Leadbetterella sp.]|nr:hypothetical protein [Leadbetterella sp.]